MHAGHAVPLTGASTEVFYAARRKHSTDAVLVGSGALRAMDGETNPVAGHCYMTSLRQIESNRRNAQRSTGPKTQSGKQRSSQNAVRHGLTAETVIGPLEDPADYRAFEQAVTTAYDAETAVERELVLRLASLLWRLRRATSVETGLLQIQYESSTAPDPALPKLPGDACEVIEIFQSGRNPSGRELARCFVRRAELENGIFERLGRYEATLWRQVRQTIFTLQYLQWRAPGGRHRRTPDRWQRTALGSADEDRADEP